MKIRCYQQKNDYFIHEIFYTKLMITMKHKSRAETQNIKKRKQKNLIKKNKPTKLIHRNTNTNRKKKWRYRQIRKQKTKRPSPHLSIITLKVNRLNSPMQQNTGCLCCQSFSHSVVSDSLWPQGLWHARLPCPAPSPGAYSNSCPLSQWCHPIISSSVIRSPPAFNLSQHQGLFKWVCSSHQVAKVLELHHQSFPWIFRTDFL